MSAEDSLNYFEDQLDLPALSHIIEAQIRELLRNERHVRRRVFTNLTCLSFNATEMDIESQISALDVLWNICAKNKFSDSQISELSQHLAKLLHDD